MSFFGSIGGKYRYIRRYNEIIGVLIKYGFEDFVAYLEEEKHFSFLKKLIPKSKVERAVRLSRWEKMRLVCEELGPSFIKFGQIISNHPDLFDIGLIKELEKLQDKVPPLSNQAALAAIEKELGKTVGEAFAWFEETPFASASMAQVHRAILKTGEKVAIKIQRPGIKEIIFSDIIIMEDMAKIFNRRIPSLRHFDPVGLVKNFEESIKRELDFIHESINLQRFRNNLNEDLKDEGYITCPKVFREFTTERMLVLEFIDGIKISDVERLTSSNLDPKIIAERLAKAYFNQVFNHGFFHADPHPGNILILPKNRICLLDFGMMGNIMKRDIHLLCHLFLAVETKDIKKIVRLLQQLSDNMVVKNTQKIYADINEFVYNNAARNIHANEMSTLLLGLRDIIVEHELKVPSHFFLLVRSMATLEGVITKLSPELELSKIGMPYFIRVISRDRNPIEVAKRLFNSIYEAGLYLDELPREVRNAVRKINRGELTVDLNHKGVDPLVHTMNRLGKQLISALIIAALLVGSSLLIVSKIHPLWWNTSAFGIIGLILASVIALGMLRNIGKGDHDDWQGWK